MAQTATLNASYTVNGVTKTATKAITLAKRTLTDIAIAGDATIATGSTATYTCTATWSYGDATTVTTTWSVTPTTYASVSSSGVVTNKNTTTTAQTATLNTSYTIDGVTKTASKSITLSKKVLTGVTVVGNATIATGSTATYTCTATWSYGDTSVVTPTWSLSSTNYASVETDGKVINKNATDNEQTVTLNASYTVDDVTKTASKAITLVKRTLTGIAIDGDTVIPTGGTATYTSTATWSYGDTTAITPTWTVIRIPPTIEGVPVTVIGSSAFSSNTTLLRIYLPDSVTHIMDSAFKNCSNLTACHLGGNIVSISSYAFAYTAVNNISLPETLTNLSSYAFYYDSKLESIVIPGSVKRIQYATFWGCSRLTSIILSEGVEAIDSAGLAACKISSLHIPASLTTIAEGALQRNSSYSEVTVGGATRTVGIC